MLRELWRKSCGCWHYLQLADPAKIGKETTNLQSLTKKVARICTHSGKAVKEQHCWHHKLGNSQQWDLCIYSIGDIVFARRSTCSDSKRGRVDKLMHPFMGPCWIVQLLPGASYKLKFASNPYRKDKKACLQSLSLPPRTHTFSASRQCR
jgi:hypothetical protein